MSKVIGIIIFVFLLVGSPVVIMLWAVRAPVYLNIMMGIWIALLIVIFSVGKESVISSIKTRIIISIFPTLIYAIAFGSWFSENIVDRDKNGYGSDIIGGYIIPCIASVSFCYVGAKIRGMIDSKRKEKYVKINDSLSNEIKGIELHIAELNEQIDKQKSTMALINLMSTCGSNTSKIEKQPNFKDIKRKYDEINEKEQEISVLKEKIRKNQSIIDYI